ncbi:MAG: UvrD-helicase domain-containing protein [Planctomycetota bacterium]
MSDPTAVLGGDDLTPEQIEIADLPTEARTIVTAGSGTGKTHVLAERLHRLVQNQGLQPSEDLLVLSFSRAAVEEIRRRLLSVNASVAYISANTFDSFATRLLSQVEPDGMWHNASYEDRIVAAKTLLLDVSRKIDHALPFKHILVDEIQDLVGSRAELVMALLTRCGCGFTLFGDPAQSIYDYQTQCDFDGAVKCKKNEEDQCIYNVLRKFSPTGLLERRLSRNFRAKTSETKMAMELGERLRNPDPDYEAIRSDLHTFVIGLRPIGSLRAFTPTLKRSDSGTTAILCRTNIQALLLARELHQLGLTHRLQREASDKAVPGWVAAVLGQSTSSSVSKARIQNRLNEVATAAGLDPNRMWSMLKRLDPRRGNDLNLTQVVSRIKQGSIPEELNQIQECCIVVSTIHRAKGMEFDNVIVLEPEYRDESIDESSETRVLFVAISRARREIFVAKPPKTGGAGRVPPRIGRWVQRGFGSDRFRTIAVEVCPRDIHSTDPAGSYRVPKCDVRAVQNYIETNIKCGDSVVLEKLVSVQSGQQRVFYAIRHRDQIVGVTSEYFSDDLIRILGRNETRLPKRILKLYVEGVDTVVALPATGSANGLGNTGLWQRVRVHGLGELEY